MNKVLLILILACCLGSCDYYVINAHNDHVGVVEKSSSLGDKAFKPCYEEKIFPYYYGKDRAQYVAGKNVLKSYIEKHYNNFGYTNESGYITYRFIINCEGEAGRYKIEQTGFDYREKKFNDQLVEHLFELVKTLKDWKSVEFYGDKYDSFFHLTFKITNGELSEILP